MQIKTQISGYPPSETQPQPQTETETLLPLNGTTTCQTPPPPPPTVSPPRPHLYFAYGSNLSPTQMAYRCTTDPLRSAKPLAIASLPGWRWHINEAGYANVLPPVHLRVGTSSQKSPAAEKIPVSGREDAVFGVLYEMDGEDERILDGYEGIDRMAEPAARFELESGDGEGACIGVGVDVRPREQGEGDYNKWYVDAVVVKVLDERAMRMRIRVGVASGSQDRVQDLVQDQWKGQGQVRVLVYVDEERVLVSKPNAEYIPRMNRAIREAEALGVSGRWLGDVLRRFIPEE